MVSLLEVNKRALLRFYHGKYHVRASALSFTSLLGFIPLISVLVSLLSKLPKTASILPDLQQFIFNNFIPAQGEKIYPYIESFLQHARELPLTQFIFLIAISMFLLLSIERTLSHVWRIKIKRRISMSLLMTWGVLFSAPILMVASIVISTYVFSLPWLVHWKIDVLYREYLVEGLPFFCSFVGFMLLYYVIPSEKVKFLHAMSGALLSTFLFEIAKSAFSLYLRMFPTYDAIYGALAVIPIFMIWTYFMWCIIIYGAIVVSEYGS